MSEDRDRIAQLEARVLRLEYALNRLAASDEDCREDVWNNIYFFANFPQPDSWHAGDWHPQSHLPPLKSTPDTP